MEAEIKTYIKAGSIAPLAMVESTSVSASRLRIPLRAIGGQSTFNTFGTSPLINSVSAQS
jgi:hypothetical protein